MNRIRLDQDIQPVSAFRANTAAFIDQIQKTNRPVVLTQHGHSAVVVMNVVEYERLLEEVELLRDVRVAEGQMEAGESFTHDEAKAEVLSRLKK